MADQFDVSQSISQVEFYANQLEVSNTITQVEFYQDILTASNYVVQVEYYDPAENLTTELFNLGASASTDYIGLHLIPLTNTPAGAVRFKTASGTYSIAYSL